MKKAQISEFIGIAILVLALTIFLLYNGVSSAESGLASSKRVIEISKVSNLNTGGATFPLVTSGGIPIADLLDFAVCYNVKKADYEAFSIDIDKEVEETLDSFYGKGNWMLSIESEDLKLCFSPDLFFEECSIKGDYLSYEFLLPLSCSYDYAEGFLFVK